MKKYSLTIPNTPVVLNLYRLKSYKNNPTKSYEMMLHFIVPQPWVFYSPHNVGDTLINDPHFLWNDSHHISSLGVFWPKGIKQEKEGEIFHGYNKEFFLPVVFSPKKSPQGLQEEPWVLTFTISAMVCSHVCCPFTFSYTIKAQEWINIPEKTPDFFYKDTNTHGSGNSSLGPRTEKSFFLYLVMAFFGGLILNVMPCVLPVLVLKIKSFTKGGSVRSLSSLAFMGIMTGFFLLACVFILLKEGFGLMLGWGAHMNHPWVSLIMVFTLILSAYGLLGVFHLPTPQWAVSFMPKTSSGALSAFFSGLLAVFLATPCSGPLLGPALGFAFVQNSYFFLLFFLVIGFGFGFPYVLGMLMPRKIMLPSPGPWMVFVEYIMALVFILSALWFFMTSFYPLVDEVFYSWIWGIFLFLTILPFVVPLFFNLLPIFYIGFSFILSFILGIWACFDSKGFLALPVIFVATLCLPFFVGVGYGILKKEKHRFFLGFFAPIVLSFVTLSLLPFYKPSGKTLEISMKDGNILWMPFCEKNISTLIKKGKIVLIDITGHGCLLCRLNKKVFLSPEVQKRLEKGDVVCMRGDYGKDQKILLPFLQRYGRSAIPFNMIVTKEYEGGLVLSERLSSQELLAGLES